MNLDHLKADRSFVLELGQIEVSRQIVQAIINPHSLGLRVTAEGARRKGNAGYCANWDAISVKAIFSHGLFR